VRPGSAIDKLFLVSTNGTKKRSCRVTYIIVGLTPFHNFTAKTRKKRERTNYGAHLKKSAIVARSTSYRLVYMPQAKHAVHRINKAFYALVAVRVVCGFYPVEANSVEACPISSCYLKQGVYIEDFGRMNKALSAS
jgi:hypothetical protein